MQITTIGLDLAKSVFQLHAVDANGVVVWRKKLRRSALLDTFAKLPACLVGMEACATSHYWARQISALGHEVRLMPPAYVKAYLRRQKNDGADAEAICEAVRRPTMRFVPVKSAERQAVLVLHRSRELLVRQRTMLINAIRGHCAEFGLVEAQGVRRARDLVDRVIPSPAEADSLRGFPWRRFSDSDLQSGKEVCDGRSDWVGVGLWRGGFAAFGAPLR